ncbi:unnamed protein product [Schistocephalus solidus]|uniref:Nanos-type domain-containing protein n=1 Tax=Schistocephalus solidus TaxID=70667 RepID=A0A183STT7_SCHSO|nr:unnamed protein product [Schistocephalus solidus]
MSPIPHIYSMPLELSLRVKTLTYATAGTVKLDRGLLNQLLYFLRRIVKEIRRLDETTQAICVFCRNNHETFEIYSSHRVKDRDGRVICPILRNIICPLCSATGDAAHTVRFCPQAVIQKRPTVLAPALSQYYSTSGQSPLSSISLLNYLQLCCTSEFRAASSAIPAVLR